MKKKLLSIFSAYTWENYLFLLLLLLNCLPLFLASDFVTLDGGAHAYNTTIISQLLFHPQSIYHDYFSINPEPVPNWFTHAFLVLLKTVLPYSAAEKTLVFLYLLLTPLFFRKTVLLLAPGNKPLTYCMIPFVHFLMLYLGFFNFCYGVLFAFLGMYLWTKMLPNKGAWKWVTMFLLAVATYFSHIFPFVVLVMYCFTSGFANYLKVNGTSFRQLLSSLFPSFIRPALLLTVAFLPLLWFLYNYFASRPATGTEVFRTRHELVDLFTHIKPLQIYGETEAFWLSLLFYWLLLLTAFTLVVAIRGYVTKKGSFREDFLRHNFILLAVFLAGLLFVMPDDDGYGGYISIRIVLFIWFFILLWLATQKTAKVIQWIFIIGLLGLHTPLLILKSKGIQWTASDYHKIRGMEEVIPEGSVVVQMYYNDGNWLGHHMSNYLAAEKSILILDNYEAAKNYFPIIWKEEAQIPNFLIAGKSVFENCVWWKTNPYNQQSKPVQFVLLIGERHSDDCFAKTRQMLEENSTVAARNGDVVLYRLK